MQVRFKKLTPSAPTPVKAHATDAGFDLTAVTMEHDDKTQTITYGTGLAFEIPDGYVGYVFPRSSVYRVSQDLSNAVGVVDAGYRGEVTCKFRNTGRYCGHYKVGDRVAQIIIMPIPPIELTETRELTTSERGTGGYGSTGH